MHSTKHSLEQAGAKEKLTAVPPRAAGNRAEQPGPGLSWALFQPLVPGPRAAKARELGFRNHQMGTVTSPGWVTAGIQRGHV